jgi:hypothetical protein
MLCFLLTPLGLVGFVSHSKYIVAPNIHPGLILWISWGLLACGKFGVLSIMTSKSVSNILYLETLCIAAVFLCSQVDRLT